MEAGKARPFRDGPGDGNGWELDYTNPIVSAFSDADAQDLKNLGHVGTLSGNAANYAPIWRIVGEAHVPLSDIIENWTLDMMLSFLAFREMNADYRSAWGEYYKQKPREKDGQ